MHHMDWQRLPMDASNLIWIGNGRCTLGTMEMFQGLQGAIVSLHNDGVSNGEIVLHLEYILQTGGGNSNA